MTDYSNAVIYTITTANGLYVGSTRNYNKRKIGHRDSLKQKRIYKLYQNILENSGEYEMKIYKEFPCNNSQELRIEEERIICELNPNLNIIRAYETIDERLIKNRKKTQLYYKDNKQYVNKTQNKKIICECGLETSKRNIARHRKSDRHKKLMDVKV